MNQQEITERALTVPDQARAVEIKSNDDFVRAGEILLVIKDLRKQIDETFDPIIKKQHEAHKEAVAQKKKVDAPLVEAENIIKPRIAAWSAEQERIRREEEARLRKIAQKEDEDRRLHDAILAEETGDKAMSEEILSAPAQSATVVVPKSVPKVAGVNMVKQWKFRIVNPAMIPREYLTPDEIKIGGVVRALKDQAHIPGVEVYSVDNVSAGRRAA